METVEGDERGDLRRSEVDSDDHDIVVVVVK